MSSFGFALVLTAALLLDRLLGDPPNRFHPVCLIGRWAEKTEAFVRKYSGEGFIHGLAAAMAVLAPASAIAYLAVYAAGITSGTAGSIIAASLALYLCVAPEGLARHAGSVFSHLENGDLPSARKAVSLMVSRSTESLDEESIARACVESVAENLTDGAASPIFLAAIGGLLFDFPGAAAGAVLHRTVNTLDSMWGYRNRRYWRFGTFAARFDDVLNYLPARICVPVTAMAAAMIGLHPASSLRTGLRDGRSHESPNSGWTEAAFAGALGIRIGGPAVYGNDTVEHPWIGGGSSSIKPDHIKKAVKLMRGASILFSILMLVIYGLIKRFF